MSVVNALPSPRRADPELGEVCPSATDVPLVAEVPPYLRQALVTDEVTEPAVGALALEGPGQVGERVGRTYREHPPG
jgi:hypothetical protein